MSAMNSIWVSVNAGDRAIGDDGTICELAKYSRKMIVTPTTEFIKIKDAYRAGLHRQLDAAIDEINTHIELNAKPKSKQRQEG